MRNFKIENITQIDHIPNYRFTGYYWMSDSNQPVMLNDEPFPQEEILNSVNPFCIEALLYAEKENISIHVMHTGTYLVSAYDINAIGEMETGGKADTIKKEYLPHRLNGVKKVKFLQIWAEELVQVCKVEPLEVDENNSFPTLTPTALIFTGFKY